MAEQRSLQPETQTKGTEHQQLPGFTSPPRDLSTEQVRSSDGVQTRYDFADLGVSSGTLFDKYLLEADDSETDGQPQNDLSFVSFIGDSVQALHESILDQLIGEILETKYRVIRRIGSGWQNVVYEAEDLGLPNMSGGYDRRAVKLRQPTAQDQEHDRLQTEAKTILTVSGTTNNIVRIDAIGKTTSGESFVVMELIHGFEHGSTTIRDLERYLGTFGPLSRRRAAQVVHDLSVAMDLVHSKSVGNGTDKRPIAHGDLKPGNILLQPGERQSNPPEFCPKIADFGIGAGTEAYMSPERKENRSHPTPRDDTFALGMLLYQLVKNKLAPVEYCPHKDADRLSVFSMRTSPEGREDLLGDVDLDSICRCCLHPDANKRYQPASSTPNDHSNHNSLPSELTKALKFWLDRRPLNPTLGNTPYWKRGLLWAERSPVRAVLSSAAVFLLCLTAFSAITWINQQDLLQKREKALDVAESALQNTELEKSQIAAKDLRRALEVFRNYLNEHAAAILNGQDAFRTEAAKPPIPNHLAEDIVSQMKKQDRLKPLLKHLWTALDSRNQLVKEPFELTELIRATESIHTCLTKFREDAQMVLLNTADQLSLSTPQSLIEDDDRRWSRTVDFFQIALTMSCINLSKELPQKDRLRVVGDLSELVSGFSEDLLKTRNKVLESGQSSGGAIRDLANINSELATIETAMMSLGMWSAKQRIDESRHRMDDALDAWVGLSLSCLACCERIEHPSHAVPGEKGVIPPANRAVTTRSHRSIHGMLLHSSFLRCGIAIGRDTNSDLLRLHRVWWGAEHLKRAFEASGLDQEKKPEPPADLESAANDAAAGVMLINCGDGFVGRQAMRRAIATVPKVIKPLRSKISTRDSYYSGWLALSLHLMRSQALLFYDDPVMASELGTAFDEVSAAVLQSDKPLLDALRASDKLWHEVRDLFLENIRVLTDSGDMKALASSISDPGQWKAASACSALRDERSGQYFPLFRFLTARALAAAIRLYEANKYTGIGPEEAKMLAIEARRRFLEVRTDLFEEGLWSQGHNEEFADILYETDHLKPDAK
jgi:serine/threonine protein kinase